MATKFNVSMRYNEKFNASDAKLVLGFREAREGETGLPYTDENGRRGKFVLEKNKHNRPIKMSGVKRYKNMHIAGEFAGQPNSFSETTNGEPLIIDANGEVTSAAHRCLGLILAQMEVDRMRNLGQTEGIEEVPEMITAPFIIVEGIDPAAADTVDTGFGRSLGDVFFRRDTFPNGQEISTTTKTRLARELAVATRLVWLRLRGEQVAGGGKFTFTEALAFSESHPLLVDCLLHCYTEDGGKDRKISTYLSLGYAAAMMYLMAYSGTDRAELEDGSLGMTKLPKLYKHAEEFWTFFSKYKMKELKEHKDEHAAIAALHTVLDKNCKSDAKLSRDTLCSLVARAWLGYAGDADGKKAYSTAKGLQAKLFRKVGTGDDAKEILDLTRVGGFDLDYEVLQEHGWIKQAIDTRIRLVAGAWKVGDTAWVDQPQPVGPWFGEIAAFSLKGDRALCRSKETGDVAENDYDAYSSKYGIVIKKGEQNVYEADITWLKTEKPAEQAPPPTAGSPPTRKPPVAPVGK